MQGDINALEIQYGGKSSMQFRLPYKKFNTLTMEEEFYRLEYVPHMSLIAKEFAVAVNDVVRNFSVCRHN